MSSPIIKRNDITPLLDDLEEEFLEAFHEYRETDFYQDFNNYKSYY